MATQTKPFLTPEQYLEIERQAEFKSVYYQGEMFAMAGAREVHVTIVGNLFAQLHQQVRARPCRAWVADLRVRVSPELYTYPDVVVVCGEPQFLNDTRDTLLNPNLIVEVLSPYTEAYDRGLKFEHYRSLPSVSQYLTVASDRVSAERFTRQPSGAWLLTAVSHLEDSLELESVGCRLALADVYEKVDLTQTASMVRPLS